MSENVLTITQSQCENPRKRLAANLFSLIHIITSPETFRTTSAKTLNPVLKISENLQTITNSPCKKVRNGDDVDRLSNLHDSILCHIISKLETREAVKTSLLSSRYKSLWINITSLSFDALRFGPHKLRFAHFVSRVLFVLKSKSINNFFLKLDAPLELYDVSFWFSAAIGMHVKVLKLTIERGCVNNSITLPSCLYTSKTLEVLKIHGCGTEALIIDVPELVSLPKLRKLELEHVYYSSDDSARRLITGCSSLEKLGITRDVYDNAGTFTIDCPTLKILSYLFLSGKGFVEHDFKFELNAPALIDLHFVDETSREFSVVNLCSLEHATIVLLSSKTADIDSDCEGVVQLIQEIYDVNHLWISGVALEALSHPVSPQQASVWHSLLIVDTNKDFKDYFERYDDFRHLYLSKDPSSSDTTHVVRWCLPKVLPVCLLSYLETISVSGFRGRESELGMIAYILKNAMMLKKMIISEATFVGEANVELRQKIMKLDQGSGRCKITFKDKDEDEDEEQEAEECEGED